jgi:hypothetical protein
MLNFFTHKTKTHKNVKASNSVYMGAKAGMVSIFYRGAIIPLTPDLADQIAAHLPRYANIARNLAESNKPAEA